MIQYFSRTFFGIAILGLLLSFSACLEEPTLSLPEEKMVEVMTDMFLAEAAMQRLTKKVKDTLSETYYQQIYTIHEITEAEYLKDLKVLEEHPKLAKSIYDQVLTKVTKLENED